VLLVLDVSGSMAEPADPADPSLATRLDLAKQAAIDAIDLFAPDDEIGLRIFTTDIEQTGDESVTFIDLVDYGRVADVGEAVRNRIRDLIPLNGTPLYDVTSSSYQRALEGFDDTRINAVVLLTDGVNDDGQPSDDQQQLEELLAQLRAGSEGETSRPVRVFTIAYSEDADGGALRRIAEASAAASYQSTDPTSIDQVLTAVVSNF
jgi:Ca-activated chloride channel family protein